ncbi:MAG: cytochrome c [Acidimicrobiaceae bacterium]|nr:cytochrome c [Acidimicrobiaceae bacterium]MYF42596.1 cytochrome c [Acidimicrobiaceae bacterium]MYJ36361.1 cytochrome c [Acidimicrobiaceae bacterium]
MKRTSTSPRRSGSSTAAYPRSAQTTRPTATSSPATTKTRSERRRRWGRVGSNPMVQVSFDGDPPAPHRAMLRRFLIPHRLLVAALVVAIAAAGACAADDVPEVPVGPDGYPDRELVAGRQVYIDRCANCHGNDGGGGRGTRLSDGRMVAQYPNIADQVEIIADGVRSMPGFAEVLDAGEIAAVVRYTREVL